MPMFQFQISVAHGAEQEVETTKKILNPEIDTFVHGGDNADRSFEEDEKLIIGNGREGFLRFNLNDLDNDEIIVKATLNLFKLDRNSTILQITHISNDEWVNKITFNSKPKVDGEIITEYPTSGSSIYIDADLTSAVQHELSEGNGLLSFNLERIEGQYPNEFSSSRAIEEQKPYLEIETMTHETLVAADKSSLAKFNGLRVTNDMDLPSKGELGSTITWESSNEEIITNEGVVTRPPAGQDVDVTLTATLQSGDVLESYSVIVTVPQGSEAAIQTYELSPVADVFVHNNVIHNNWQLLVGSNRQSFIQFDLSEVSGDIVDAELRLFNYHGHHSININIAKVEDNNWGNDVEFNNLPEVGQELTSFSTAGNTGQFYRVDMTDIFKNEVLEDNRLSLNLNSVDSANEFYSSRGLNAPEDRNFESGQELALIVTTMTVEARVAADKAWVEEQFEGRTVTDHIILPEEGEWGSAITWESSNENIISNDGEVNRPSETEENAEVVLTAKIQYGDVVDSQDVNIQVPKVQPVSPYMRESLENVIELGKEMLAEIKVGSSPGKYPELARDQFEAEISAAEEVLADDDGNYTFAVHNLIASGNDFFNAVITSDKVIDEENNLEYSEYRKELVQLVWEAKTIILVEPQMYTEATKLALNEQIERAERVLNDEYELPFVRNREFLTPRPDEDIQFAIEYMTRTPSYGMSTYGLKPAIQWYKSQYILNDAFATYLLKPTEDTFVHEANKGINYGENDKAIIGGGRTTYLKFDLSEVPGTIKQSNLFVSNAKNDNNFVHAHFIEDDNWTESELTYNNAPLDEDGELSLGPIIAGWQLGSMNNRSSVPLTDITVREQQNDQILSLALTNSPSANFPSEIYTKEYSDEARQPELVLTLDTLNSENLDKMYKHVTGLANDLLASAESGNRVGQYPSESIQTVKDKLAILESIVNNGTTYDIGESFVSLYDVMREMRQSQVLRTDIDDSSYLFFTEEGLQEIRDKIDTNPVFAAEYEELKAISDAMTLEEIKGLDALLDSDFDEDALNEKYSRWSPVSNQNFNIPENAAYANIEIILPSAENEEDGLGHVWIDNLRIYSATGGDLDIRNASFEEGNHVPESWEQKVISGTPVLKWEERPNYAAEGKKSLYLENPTSNDQGAWVYKHDIPVSAGDHTLTYQVKNDGVFNEGINVIISYKDEEGNSVGSPYINKNNHKSAFGSANFNLAFQADALLYAVTKDETYAEKAKERMIWFLNDHLQGVENWLVNNQRPFGYDAYGAVQTGRNASVLASSYSLIKDADVFTEEEYDLFLRQVNYMLRNLLDIRDRTELGLYEAQVNTGNWETDMAMGAALLGMTFGEELSHARQWIDNGKLIVDGQLQYTLREDGAWPESIRYHFAVLEKIGPFAKALRNTTGEDWFKGDSVLNKMFKFAVEVQTPPYEYFNNGISTPNFGDHILGDGKEFSSLGLYYDEIATTDTELGAQVYQTWARAGKQFADYWGESITIANFFSPYDYDNSDNYVWDLQSTDYASPWGMLIFRNHFGTENETFMALLANEEEIGHHHNDQGSFILYANKVPLVMDPGIESYFDTSRRWFVSSDAHSVVQFKDETYRDTPRTSKQEEFFTSSSFDYSRVSVNHPSGASKGIQTRNIAYLKDDIEAFIIWDQINNADDMTRFNLPVAAKSTKINGNIAESTGHYHMDLQTTVLQPSDPMITQEFARTHAQVPAIDGINQLNYLRVEAEKSDNFLTILKPQEKGEDGLINEELVNEENIQAYKMIDGDGKWFVVAVNDSDSKQTVTLPVSEELVDRKENIIYTSENGEVQIPLEANSLNIFVSEASDSDVDTTELESAINSAQDLIDAADIGENPGEYSQQVVDTLKAAIQEAQNMVNDSTSTQSDIDAAVVELNNAVGIFEESINPNVEIDTAELKTAINSAQDLIDAADIGENPGEYSQQVVDTLKAAIQEAKNVVNDSTSTQSDIDAAVVKLNKAVNTFEDSVNVLPIYDDKDEEKNKVEGKGKDEDQSEDADESKAKDEAVDKDKITSKNKDGDKELPSTATSIFNWLVIGFILLSLGIVATIFSMRRKSGKLK